jgi:hypothetical protein
METTIVIDINDYLSESEKKEYAIEAFNETNNTFNHEKTNHTKGSRPKLSN